ncbi:MAG: hypothetical protein JWO13_3197 [Acidobacteriales bacterium]|nr:hypothetical protein [Terriglobales bacterium]
MISVKSNKAILLCGGILLEALALIAIVRPGSNTIGERDAFLYFCALVFAFSIGIASFVRHDFSNLTSWWIGMFLLQFGLAPIFCKLLQLDEIDPLAVKALFLVMVGTVAFWAGAKFVDSQSINRRFLPTEPGVRERVMRIALAFLALGTVAKSYMLANGLFSYVSERKQLESSYNYVQWLDVVAGLTISAQIVLTIEYFQARTDARIKFWFYAVTAVNIGFGLLSGMKGQVLVVPILIFLIGSLVTMKRQWRVVGIGFALLLILIPLNNFYREEVHSGGAITSVASGNAAYSRAVTSANEDSNSALTSFALEGIASRLNLLPIIAFVERNDENLAALEGDEKIWMIPFYPFVPRFLWKNKPILDKGRRMSLAMDGIETSATAVTPIGDLLVMGGVTALFIGMFFVGITIQWITNLLSGDYGAKVLFIYVSLFTKLYGVEFDIFMLFTSIIQALCVILVVSYCIYGGKIFGTGRQLAPNMLNQKLWLTRQ